MLNTLTAFSQQANYDLEAIDSMLAQLAAAAQQSNPATIVTVVSDHGFAPLAHKINLYIPFLEAGLIEAAQDTAAGASKFKSWKAQPWLAGGMAAIMLRDPNDRNTESAVAELLQILANQRKYGIASILDRAAIKMCGGFPDAAFIVVFKSGYYTSSNLTGDIVTDMQEVHGGHGISPNYPDMRAAFFIAGSGIAHHRDLGVIDMRQIAPTVATLLKATLPASHAVPLYVAQ